MKRKMFLGIFLGLIASAVVALSLQGGPRKPNIILILADNLGYGNLGSYGQKQILTPNLDRFAAEGIRFTEAYAGSTVCAPSRCSLMTGVHTGHARIRGNKADIRGEGLRGAEAGLRADDITIAEVLKKAGYRTGIFGKWGLGGPGTDGQPNDQGFDEWFGFLDQLHAHNYYPQHLWDNRHEVFILGNHGGAKKAYSHDLFTQRALSFVERHHDKPFFLYLPYTIPHPNNEVQKITGDGMEVPDYGLYKDKAWPNPEKGFAAMVTRMDSDIGKLMALLKRLEIDEDTIVFFMSDNGPHGEGGHNPDFFDDNGPLRGIIRVLYDGAIRVPALARWPGKIKPAQVNDHIWASWDFLPTMAEIAGVSPPSGLDGISFLPTLLGKPQKSHEYLYWEFQFRGFSQAIRMGDWKGVRVGSRSRPLELYNLKKDIGEQNDVAAHHPDIVKKIVGMMDSAHTDSSDYPIQEARF